jgi:flagellar basal-body rod protein FlgG
MVRGLYSAYTGMVAQQQKMDIVSNNLANVDTTGFKKDGAIFKSFKDAYTFKINDPETSMANKIGTLNQGVNLDRIYTDHTQGSLKQTDDPLNIAIDEQGMIVVGKKDKDGNVIEHYTRDGSLAISSTGDLITKDGYNVLGNNGPIKLDNNHITIDRKGNIYSDNKFIDKIKLVNIDNKDTLRKVGNNIYSSTEDTTTKEFTGKIEQGFLEASNVNSVEEMIEMINVMRAYESNQKIITTYDSILEKSVNSIGRL